VCAFEFITLGVKEIGSSDVFAEVCLQLYKDAKQKRFCRKKSTCVDNSVPWAVVSKAPSISPLKASLATASGTELKVVRIGRKFSGGGVRLKKRPLFRRQSLLTSHRRGNNFRSPIATGCA
jgi:hypothetical protein